MSNNGPEAFLTVGFEESGQSMLCPDNNFAVVSFLFIHVGLLTWLGVTLISQVIEKPWWMCYGYLLKAIHLVIRVNKIVVGKYFAEKVTCLQEKQLLLDTRLHSRVSLLGLFPCFEERTQVSVR